MEQLVTFEVARLAKEKGCKLDLYSDDEWHYIDEDGDLFWCNHDPRSSYPNAERVVKCSQSLLQKFIRETRGVHIEIHRNASGYYWSMCKADGGTDLGWSNHSGANDGGVWDSFEGALENALQVQLSYDLPNDITIIKHWGNYVEFALKSK